MRFNAHRLLAPLAAALMAAAITHPLHAQNTITLEGSVKAEGSPIANAQVTVVNTATQETARSATRANGEFRVLGLFTGQYAVTVRALGYKPSQRPWNWSSVSARASSSRCRRARRSSRQRRS